MRPHGLLWGEMTFLFTKREHMEGDRGMTSSNLWWGRGTGSIEEQVLEFEAMLIGL